MAKRSAPIRSSAPDYPGAAEFRLYLAQAALELDHRPTTKRSYELDLCLFGLWLRKQNRGLDQVDRDLLERYLIELPDLKIEELDPDRTWRKWRPRPEAQTGTELRAARTRARHLAALRGFFLWRSLEGRAATNPAENLEGLKLDKHLPGVLAQHEIDQIMSQVTGEDPAALRDRAMLEVAYSCGLRVSELVGLRRRQVLLDLEPIVEVDELGRRQEIPVALLRVEGKGGKQRLVPMGERAIAVLKQYLQFGRPAIRGTDRKGNLRPLPAAAGDSLFLNHHGRPLTRFGFWRILKDHVERAGIDPERVKPHTFRHSFATHLIEGGADLRVVQELLGHSSIATTEIYTHLDRDFLREVVTSFHPRK